MLGFFKKFKDGFSKTVSTIASKTAALFGQKPIDASSLETLEEALYSADFGVETTEEILEEIKRAYKKDKSLRGQEAAAIGASVLKRVLEGAEGVLDRAGTPDGNPVVIAMIGVNGSGKTTTSAKLAWRLKEEGHGVLRHVPRRRRRAAQDLVGAPGAGNRGEPHRRRCRRGCF